MRSYLVEIHRWDCEFRRQENLTARIRLAANAVHLNKELTAGLNHIAGLARLRISVRPGRYRMGGLGGGD